MLYEWMIYICWMIYNPLANTLCAMWFIATATDGAILSQYDHIYPHGVIYPMGLSYDSALTLWNMFSHDNFMNSWNQSSEVDRR